VSGPRQPPTPAEAREAQREAWSLAAPAWDRWFAHFEAFAGPLGAELGRRVALAPGLRLLDVGCGHGEPALSLARVVGPTGAVTGVDLAEPMVEIARRRASGMGIGHATFQARDASELGGLGPFDAAVSRFALMLAPDPEALARAVRGVLRPGARFAVCVWGEARDVPFCSLPAASAERALGVDPPPPEAPGATRLGAPGRLASTLAAGGFRDVVEDLVRVTPRFASVDEAVRFYLDVSGGLRRALASRPPADAERAREELARALAPHARPDGSVVLESAVRVAHGTAA
jgi:SAM-dependent methyltransferase